MTGQIRTQPALRDSEAELRALLSAMPDVVIVFGKDGRYLRIAPTSPAPWQRPSADLLGRTLHETYSRTKADEFLGYIQEALTTHQPVHFEYALLTEDRVTWFAGVTSPITDDTVIWVGRDITDRKLADEQTGRRMNELEVLHEGGLALARALDEKHVGEQIIRILEQRMEWHHAAVRLVREGTEEVELVAFSRPHHRQGEADNDKQLAEAAISSIAEGMTGWVIKHGRSINSSNLSEDPRYHATFPGMHSGLYAPIWAAGRALGCIAVESDQLQAFDENDERLLITLAGQAAVAIENTRLYRAAIRAADRRSVLYAAGQEMVRVAQVPEQVYDAVRSAVSQLMPAEAFVITLLDEERALLHGVYLFDQGQRYPAIEIPFGEGIVGHVIASGETLYIPDDLESTVSGIPYGSKDPVRSILCVPLRVGGRVTGAVSTQSYRANAYDQEDIFLLEMLAAEAAIAIENTRLFEKTSQRAQQFESLFQVASEAALPAQAVDVLLGTIIDRALQLLHAGSGGIYLYDAAQNDLVMSLAQGIHLRPGIRLRLGEGAAGRVALTREPIIIDDYQHWDARSPRYEGVPIAAVLQVPMLYGGELIGVISVDEPAGSPRKYTQDDARLLSLLASTGAGAVYSARLFEKTRRHAQQLESINALGRALAETLDLKIIYERLARVALDLLPDSATLLLSLHDPERQRIIHAYGLQDGQPVDTAGSPPLPLSPPGAGAESKVIHTAQPLIVNDLQERHQGNRVDGEPVDAGGQTAQSALYVPMVADGKAIGVLQLQSRVGNRYTPGDAELLSLVANTAAVAIQNAALFTKLQQRVDQLSGLHAIDIAIGSTADLHMSLRIVLDNVLSLLNVDAAAILLVDQASLTLQPETRRGFRTAEIGGGAVRFGEGLAGRAALDRQLLVAQDAALEEDIVRAPLIKQEQFSTYAVAPLITKGQVRGVLEVYRRAPLLVTTEWQDLLDVLAGQAALAVDSGQMFAGLERANVDLTLAYDATIEGWSQALDLRDKETEGHTKRVTDLTLRLARRMELPPDSLIHVRRGALLHDIGKMGIPDGILLKNGPLTDSEWEIMRRHPQYAFDLLSRISYLHAALDIPYCHHEKWDGTGYPRRLKGEQIPLVARIFAVVDVYDALTSDRPYRLAWSKKKAIGHIREQAGSQFDPTIAEAFLNLIQEKS